MKSILLFQFLLLSVLLLLYGCKEKIEPPVKPATLTLNVVSQTEIDLTWSDNSTNESGFKIERSQNNTSNWSVIISTAADIKSFKNTGLTAATIYSYRILAFNSAGNSDYSNAATATTLPALTLPEVTTVSVSSITSVSASGGGNVTSDGNTPVTSRGVCWSINTNPTVADSKTTDGSGTGSFTSSITGLSSNTLYYVRAYAANAVGTAYGNSISFTSSPGPPSVSTASASMLASTMATFGGNVTNDDGASVTARGVCWNTSTNPTVANSKTTDGSGTGTFTSSITGLSPGITYYIRAYATSSAGTGYGSNVTITTPARVNDIDGNSYNVVIINSQYWMQQNLKVSRYNDGTNLIPYSDTLYSPVSYYHMYNNNASYGITYGYMYNGYVISAGKNICPTGWHVPYITEWSSVSTFLGGNTVAGGKMKDTGTTYWNPPNTGADNTSGFSARGGGYYFNTYADLKNASIWWTGTSMRYVRMDYNSTSISGIGSTLTGTSENAFYIRCKKD